MNTVTRDGWNVSTTWPLYDKDYKVIPGVELHTFKFRHHPTPRRGEILQKGEGYGRRFATQEEATKWALEHGYLQRYTPGAWCRVHRVQHTFLGKRTSFCYKRKQTDEPLHAQYCPLWNSPKRRAAAREGRA